MLTVEAWVAAEAEATVVLALHFHEDLLVLGAEALEDVGVHDDEEVMVALWIAQQDAVDAALEFDAHGFGALDFAMPVAILAVIIDGFAEALVEALAGHFHEA